MNDAHYLIFPACLCGLVGWVMDGPRGGLVGSAAGFWCGAGWLMWSTRDGRRY